MKSILKKVSIMRVLNFPSKSLLITLSFCLGGLLSACSTSNEVSSKSTNSTSSKKVSSQKAKLLAKGIEHTHPPNPCSAALAHTHLFNVDESSQHEHSYDCEGSNEYVSNAHIHPPAINIRKYRHVHPNGANKHAHHPK